MAEKALFRDHLARLTAVACQGDAREESFYASLADLVPAWAGATKVVGVHVTTLPKATEAGNPDILTNFFEFRLYRHGALVATARLARPPLEQVEELQALLAQFFAFSLPRAHTAEELAVALPVRTRFLREQVVGAELADESHQAGEVEDRPGGPGRGSCPFIRCRDGRKG